MSPIWNERWPGAELVVLAVPAYAAWWRTPRRPSSGRRALICSVTKGIEVDNLMTMSEVLQDVLRGCSIRG